MAVFQTKNSQFTVSSAKRPVSLWPAMDRIDRRQPGWVSGMLQLRQARSGQGYKKLQVTKIFIKLGYDESMVLIYWILY